MRVWEEPIFTLKIAILGMAMFACYILLFIYSCFSNLEIQMFYKVRINEGWTNVFSRLSPLCSFYLLFDKIEMQVYLCEIVHLNLLFILLGGFDEGWKVQLLNYNLQPYEPNWWFIVLIYPRDKRLRQVKIEFFLNFFFSFNTKDQKEK